MQKKDVLQRLCDLGYARAENSIEAIPGKTFYRENYRAKMLNHPIMEHIKFLECDFDEANVTGSIFRHCKFINCSLDQADFEFCEFYGCTFESNAPIVSSFNESSFVETEFLQVHLHSCTFTGVFFQSCIFDSVQISVSTMENSLFRQCSFRNMDLRLLNMDYIELDHPYMENVILPLDQIPFIFGALQYLKDTKDSVKISKGESGSMTPTAFFKNVIPLLCVHFSKSEQYFPLANIFYSLDEKEKGYKAITDGLIFFISLRDFRMLKHFCKLIAYTGAFRPHALHDLYHNYICRLYPQDAVGLDVPNYARHIVEIKALLFSSTQRASFHLTLGTNIRTFENWKLGKVLESLFSLARHRGEFHENDIEMVLRQNSPLQITVRLSGNEIQLLELLTAYLSLAGIADEDAQELPVITQYRSMLSAHTDRSQGLGAIVRTYQQELEELDIKMVMLEYYVENFRQFSRGNGSAYFFNSRAIPSGKAQLNPIGGGYGEYV